MKRELITGTTLTAFAMTAAAATQQPNVIFIITDQQSANTISALRDVTPENYCETPNMDRLVKSGVSYLNTCCPNPGSMPSRFAMFTGLFGGAYAVRSNNGKHLDINTVMPAIEQNAMGKAFKAAGYETLYGGKVHLPYAAGKSANMHAHPTNYGFDIDLGRDERGITANNTAKFIAERKSSDKPFLLVASFINPHDICMEGTVTKSKDKYPKESSSKLSERVNMIKDVRAEFLKADKSDLPKLPYNFEPTDGYPEGAKKPTQNFSDEYWQQYRWVYKTLVRRVDNHIGKILDALDANPELKKNTIVVFTSDHGEMQGAHRAITKGYPYYECQIVPLIFSGAGIPKDKIISDVATSGVDIYPTLCDMTGVTMPSKMDGISLAALTQGKAKSKSIKRESIYNENQTFVALLKGDYKYTYFDLIDKEMLVDIKSDPGEMKNLLVTDEGKYRKTADALKAELMEIYEPRKAMMHKEEELRLKR